MKIRVAEVTPYGSPILVAVVPSEYTTPTHGADLIARIQPYFPIHPIMLVSIQGNGFQAYAPFETHRLLALIQLEYLDLNELDLSIPPPEKEEELPF
ncbi:hypothetical protein [Massilia yuzhufengensis]|uniref:Uncharacterized protein n=1 Tax=Massilia yuzhufengensis TaxID=1164594 RepID=A0A1I1VLH2_9BURK|nr:hypothetical protein [Massilia yuzhufengensis]SFD83922.1 hypothetical protein SAMN05216204_14037 [Massilia yuzhufengensis]